MLFSMSARLFIASCVVALVSRAQGALVMFGDSLSDDGRGANPVSYCLSFKPKTVTEIRSGLEKQPVIAGLGQAGNLDTLLHILYLTGLTSHYFDADHT